jgi:hypothetical protein
MAFSGASTTSSTTAAAAAAVNPADLVNVPVGGPAQERWPGALDPGQYTDQGPAFAIAGPIADPWILTDFSSGVDLGPLDGGGVQDVSWTTGTDGPQAPWDSAAGHQFAPSGALPPELHGQDTGAVFMAQHSVPPAIGQIIRAAIPAQAFNRTYDFEPVNGQLVPQLAGRMNLDQQQRWDPSPHDGGGWAPWDPGYAERPILNNVAYQATQVNDVPGTQGVAGQLPERSPFNTYGAVTYNAPPDPIVNPPAAAAAGPADGWFLG